MERLQGPINSCFFGEHLESNCLQQEDYVDTASLRLLEEEQFLTQGLEEKMPFLQMLQSVECPQLLPFKEPNFQTLLKLQHLRKPWEGKTCMPRMESQIQQLELESQDLVENMQSPLKSESSDFQNQQYSASCVGGVVSECNQEQAILAENFSPQSWPAETQKCLKSELVGREKRKRKRIRPTKNKEDIENQRMTHIAVERNRRRQMNDHLNVLRSLMPPSYIQRGDQASIIGGAIDFVKELEQLLQSLEAQKMMRRSEENDSSGMFEAPSQFHEIKPSTEEASCGDELKAENKSEAADINVTLIQTHVNLKIQCPKRPGQLIKAIVALEDLKLTILHLNITSLQASVLYSFNLKIEEDCKLGSANEIAEAVHHIFSFINGS